MSTLKQEPPLEQVDPLNDCPQEICGDRVYAQRGVAPSSSTWLRVGLALMIAGQTMVFSLAIDLSPIEHEYRWWLHGGLIAASLLVVVLLGKPLLLEAVHTVRQGRISVDQLFILSILGAFFGSLTNSIRGVDQVYYELVAILLAIYTVGKAIGARSRERVWQEWSRIEEHMDRVERKRGTQTENVRLADIEVGDQVILGAGSLIPVDGVIEEGYSYVRETFHDGSLEPRIRQPGDSVYAGGVLLDGSLQVRVEKTGEGTEWAQIRRTLLHRRSATSRWQQQADQVMQWFLPAVCLVSILTFFGWWWVATWDEGLFNAMAVLLVACPCAMGLATPLALWNGMAQLARYGVIVQSGDFLHELTRIQAVVWDKTGTLGSPEWELHAFELESGEQHQEQEWREAIYLIEGVSKHPLALTLQRLFRESVQGRGKVVSSHYIAGRGVEGEIRWANGESWKIALYEEIAPEAEPAEYKTLNLYRDGRVAGRLQLKEIWVEEAIPALQDIQGKGIPQYLFTGDQRGAQPGSESLFEAQRTRLTPSAKTEEITRLQKDKGPVLYLGDGLNDLGAMQQALVSMAVGETLPIVQSGSKALLRNHRLRLVGETIEFAKQTGTRLRQNLIFAGVYNLGGVTLAAAGLLSPVLAALLMVGASAVVSGRALQLTFTPQTS